MTSDNKIPSPEGPSPPNGHVSIPASEPTKPKPSRPTFTWFDILFLLGGMITYIADMTIDIVVGVQYFFDDKYVWAGLTFGFVVVSSITLQYFSFRWFVADSQVDGHPMKSRGICDKILQWFYWLVTHILQLGTINRYYRCLRYGWKSRSKPEVDRYHNSMVYEWRDLTMLRLLEAFLESAPQLVLQVYIVTQRPRVFWLTAATAIVSLSSLAWSLEAYHKALRDSCSQKNKINYFGVAVRIAWRTFTITSRVIALALFASLYHWRVFAVVGGHWLLMTLWLIWQDTDFCTTRVEEVLFDCVMGAIHVFCFFNLKEGRTRYRALIFYSLMFVENTVLLLMWYLERGHETKYAIPAACFVWGGFFIGIFFMLMYYRFLHPNGGIRLCQRQEEKIPPVITQIPQDSKGHDGTDGVGTLGRGSTVTDGYGTLGRGRGAFVVAKALDIRDDKEGNLFSFKGRRFCYWNGEECQELEELPNGGTLSRNGGTLSRNGGTLSRNGGTLGRSQCRCPGLCPCHSNNSNNHDMEMGTYRQNNHDLDMGNNQEKDHQIIHDKVYREGAARV